MSPWALCHADSFIKAKFYTENQGGKALWVTSFPFAQYVRHQWAGAWVCSAFRNEGVEAFVYGWECCLWRWHILRQKLKRKQPAFCFPCKRQASMGRGLGLFGFSE